MKKEVKQSVTLSHLAYFMPEVISENLSGAGYKNFEWINNEGTDTQVILCTHKNNIFIVFRGTEFTNSNDWYTNLDCDFKPISPWGYCHKGFYMDVFSVYPSINKYIKQHSTIQKIHIGGHSQGAGDASILAMLFAKDRDFDSLALVGCPRTTDHDAAESFGKACGSKIYRIVNNNDLVTRIPPRFMGYEHIKQANLYYFKENGKCVNKISAWDAFKDRINGRIEDLFEPGTDGIKDHDHGHYDQLVQDLSV
ncbi:MAG: lipase family protein [Desulfobacterales bacterium]|nr:lipase family protein [Desulfobacterales bacterium]